MKKILLSEMHVTLSSEMQDSREAGNIKLAFNAVAKAALSIFGADICMLAPVNPITNRRTASEVSVDQLKVINHGLPIPDAITEHVLGQGIWMIEDWKLEEGYFWPWINNESICSTAAFVVREYHDPQSLGVFYLHFREPQQFASDDCKSLEIFAEYVALLLGETWLHFHYREIERIQQEIDEDLSDVEILFKKLQLYITRVLDTSYSFLLAVYPLQGQSLNVFVNEGEHIASTNNTYLEGGACQYAIDTQETLFINHLSLEMRDLPFNLIHIPETEPKEFFIFLPLILGKDTFGVLSIQHAEPEAYNERHLPALKLLANHIALALRNISLYTNLSRLNTTGQVLMDLLDSENLLQGIVDQIQQDTLADIVAFYTYDAKKQEFIHPPLIVGEQSLRSIGIIDQADTIARLMLQQREPIFARESSILYSEYLPDEFNIQQENVAEHENIRSTVAIPLQIKQEIVGVLFLNFYQPQRFDAAQKLSIAVLTNYTAIAIRSAQFIGILIQRRAHEREILQRIDQELSHTLDLNLVLTTILEQANTMLKAEWASILLYDEETELLAIKAELNAEVKESQSLIIPLQDSRGITRLALTRKRPILVHNVHDPEWQDTYIAAVNNLDLISELAVPLIDGEEVVGILNFESTREGAFNTDDENFLLVLAGQTVLAVKRAKDYDKQKRLAEEEAALNQISKEIIGQFDPDASFRIILQHALTLTKSTLGSLLLYDPEKQELSMQIEYGADTENRHLRLGLHQGIVGYVARTRKLLNIDPTSSQWSHRYIKFAPGTRSELAVPMLAGDELRGVLNVESRRPHCFSKNDEKLLIGLANLAVVAQEHAERHQNALREKKRFELLYECSQSLGKLAELEQYEEAYEIVQRIAEEYSQQPISIFRGNAQVPDDIPASMVFTIEFNEDHYGYLVLSSDPAHTRQKVDRLFFDGLAQQLASTLYRLEATFSKREAEKRALSNEEMAWAGELIVEVAHLRGNTMGLIKSYVNDISKGLKNLQISNTRIDKKLDLIAQSARKMLSMNDDIVQVMSTVGGTRAIEPEILSPNELFRDIEKNLVVLPPLCTLQIEEHESGLAIHAIRSIVINILQNLVTNAINAMPNGGTITLSAYRDDRFVALEVRDTGNGIPIYLHKRIFELGYSGKGSTGFGLWSALRGARRNQGDLQIVFSQPGQGAIFRLLLPNAEIALT